MRVRASEIILDVTEKYLSSFERDIVDGLGLGLVVSEDLLQDITDIHPSNNRQRQARNCFTSEH